MIKNRRLLIGYKVLFGLLGFAAIISELATLVERGRFDAVNFFSFFTVQNNILVTVALLWGAFAVASGKASRFLDAYRGFTAVFIVIVGVGFAILLAGLQGVALTAVPWNNTVLHYIIPIAVVIDYIIDRPRAKLSFKRGLVWLLYPTAYFAYTMIRGAATGWYPYPFLNPANNDTAELIGTIGALYVLGVGLIWLVSHASGRRRKLGV